MTRTSIASRIVTPAGLALAALMLVASPVGFGKGGLMLQSAKAETSLDKQGLDTNSPDKSSVDTNGSSNSNDKSGGDSSGVGGNAGTNSGSHDGGSSGGSHDGAGDH